MVLSSPDPNCASAPIPAASRPASAGHAALSVLLHYATAILSVGVAAAATLLFWNVVSNRNPFVLFYAAVMISAWYGGIGPGLLASALAMLAIDSLVWPSFFHLLGSLTGVFQASTFVGIAGLVSWLNASRNRSMRELRRAREAADAASEAKDQFLAVLSHELRTPLTPVLALAAILEQDPSLSDDTRADAAVIRRNVELEARLIDDLLDITRIRRGKLTVARQAVEPVRLIEQVLHICRADAEAKRIEIRTVLPADCRPVDGDPARLQQILWNLLKNAIKFTPSGGQITLNCTDGGDGRITIDVTDSGIGIESAALPKIFNAFEQGHHSITHRFGGVGLGLAISKALAAAHGGTLTAASEGAGRGAVFTLALPVANDDAETPRDSRPLAQETTALKVLLVEDHPDTSDVMTRLLRNLKHDVQTAGSVRAAREMAEQQPFDVLISDIGLPDGTGLELMQALRAQRQLRGIAMSGFGMEDDIRRSLHAGFHTHLTKPVNPDLLVAAIHELAACSRSA